MIIGKLREPSQMPGIGMQMIPIPAGMMPSMPGGPPSGFKTTEASNLIDAVIENVDIDDPPEDCRKHTSAILEHFLGDAPKEKLVDVLADCRYVMDNHCQSPDHKHESPAEIAKCEVYRRLQLLSVVLELKLSLQN